MLITLCFIAVYMGTMHDGALRDGKNLVMFMLLYVIGDLLHTYQDKFSKISLLSLVLTYVAINVCLVVAYINLSGSLLGKALWLMSYPYCSPLLLINAIMLFLLFSKIRISSPVVNYLSGSVFVIYIFHHQSLIVNKLLHPVVMDVYNKFSNSPFLVLFSVACITLVVMLISITIDKLLSPINTRLVSFVGRLDEKKFFQL